MFWKRVPISVAKAIAKDLDVPQVILTVWDGQQVHVVSYGKTLLDCQQAAIGANMIKRSFQFPEELCNTVPKRTK